MFGEGLLDSPEEEWQEFLVSIREAEGEAKELSASEVPEEVTARVTEVKRNPGKAL
jgi:hypothetical protein